MTEHIHDGSQCGGYRCASCGQSSTVQFACCGAVRVDHVLLIAEPKLRPVPAATAALQVAAYRNAFDRPVPTLAQQQQMTADAVNTDPARLFRPGTRSYARYVEGRELGPCHLCGGESDGTCVICDRPVCDEDAAHQDHDRFCRGCAPSPAPATEG